MLRRSAFRHLALTLLLATPSSAHATTLPTYFSDQPVASGLNLPTSFAFLPDGRALVTEKTTGAIRMVVGTTVTGPLVTVPQLTSAGNEQGLLSIAVDPAWPVRPYVYVHHTQVGGTLRLIRFTANGALTDGGSTNLTLDSLYQVLTGLPDNSEYHNGGSLRFGPDGKLYFSVGDDVTGCPAQDRTAMVGCVFRLDVSHLPGGAGGPPARTAIAPSDNPWAQSTNEVEKLVYAYGLRNPFRFQVDPVTGKLYVGDVGESAWEELDEVTAGENEGWPWREGPAPYTVCLDLPSVFDSPIDSFDHDEGIVIISAGVYRRAFHSTEWPKSYEGDVFYADFYWGFMRRLHNDGGIWRRIGPDGTVSDVPWATDLSNPADFQWGPDGHLWWLSLFNGELRRIVCANALAVDPPGTPARLSLASVPNPARGRVEIGFDLPVAGRARVAVYDLAGRRVTTLADERRDSGHHTLTWDGRDGSGRPVQNGIYLVRLEAGGKVVTARITRID